MRKKLSLMAALIAFFAMTAVTFAANTAQINVTSEPITWKAECDKAGAISFSFDHNTTFVSGDIITADLPLNVSLCKDIDFIAGIARGGADPLPYDNTFVIPAIGTDDAGPITGDGTFASTGGGVVFWVRGEIGSQRVTITVLSDFDRNGVDEVDLVNLPSITFVATDPNDVNAKLVFNILDQKVYTSLSGLFTDRNRTAGPNGTYFIRTVASENTLCINVSHADFNNEYVKMSFDSKGDKYTWIPSDPQVAHVVPQKTVDLAACVKPECGYIPTPSAATQGSSLVCYPINNEAGNGIGVGAENYAGYADGYCPSTHRNNRMILQNVSGEPFDAGMYQIQLEILVDGKTGDQGAYFAGPIGYASTSTLTAACEATSAAVGTIYYNAADDSNVYQLDAAGTVLSGLSPASDMDCSIGVLNRITKVKTVETSFFNGTDQDFLFVDIPNIVWDASLFTEGENLTVRVKLLKAPCGIIATEELCIGTRGCPTATDPNLCREYTRVYPFFGKEADYINVLGITNTTSASKTFAVTVYEKDGDMFSGSIEVGANQVLGTILADLPSATLLAGSTGSGVLGDSQAYAVVKVVSKDLSSPFIGWIYLFDNTKKGQSFSTILDSNVAGVTVDCP